MAKGSDFLVAGGDQGVSTTDTPSFTGLGTLSKSTSAPDSIMIAGGGNATVTGDDNICIGSGSGSLMGFANNNTLIGKDAGGDLTSGYSNIFIGGGAGGFMDTGNTNVCIGQSAGANALDNTKCTVIGNSAGNSGFLSCDKVILIGYNSKSVNGAQNKCIIGGTGADAVNTGFGGNIDPAYEIDVTGDINCSGVYRTGGTTGVVTFTGAVTSITITNGIVTAIS